LCKGRAATSAERMDSPVEVLRDLTAPAITLKMFEGGDRFAT
jgi:hypothetical protein